MIRYAYTPFLSPPAPFVHVTLRCPETGRQADDVPAQIDTAADRTVLPERVVEALGLAQMGHILIAGFGGHVTTSPTFAVAIAIRTLQPVTIKVAASDVEPYVLLGRDVLNHFRILLDGPQLALEIG